MPRNLDLTALRSFIAVADTGGVTKASRILNLTQSAVSMQLKRLEDSLDQALLERSGRGVSLTPAGEQLLSYGRKILLLNDEVYTRMTDTAYEGELVLGVPHDIVYPAIPQVMQLFNLEFPRVRVQIQSLVTEPLMTQFVAGKYDLIVTTERGVSPGGETLAEKHLQWYGAPKARAWQRRPLPIASEPNCAFRQTMIDALDKAGIPWIMAVESDSSRTIEAAVAADLAVMALLSGTQAPHLNEIAHHGGLPNMGAFNINLYQRDSHDDAVIKHLAHLIRRCFQGAPIALTA